MHVARDYWNGACQMSRLMLASHQEVTAVNQAVPDCNRTWKKNVWCSGGHQLVSDLCPAW